MVATAAQRTYKPPLTCQNDIAASRDLSLCTTTSRMCSPFACSSCTCSRRNTTKNLKPFHIFMMQERPEAFFDTDLFNDILVMDFRFTLDDLKQLKESDFIEMIESDCTDMKDANFQMEIPAGLH